MSGRAELLALLNYLFIAALLAVLCGILGAAMVLQYAGGELPCPLCLLERLGMIGIGFGALLTFCRGEDLRHAGYSLVSALFLLVVATRQSLLDIYPRPGHAYIGSAVLGLHMPIWAILVALAVLIAYALKFCGLGGDPRMQAVPPQSFPRLYRAGKALGALLILLAIVNAGSVVVQCGFGQCHTMDYRLL